MRRTARSVSPILACVAALLSAASPANAQAADKPNIVLVFMDNFGWGEPGFNGGGIIRGAATPRLDALAAEGIRLTNFNVESQCTPGGIGGRGLLPSRELDTFGVGLFYAQVQETSLSGVLGIDDHSQGVEAFYDVALTPAARLTFDLQVLDSPLPQVDTAVVLGLRLSTRF